MLKFDIKRKINTLRDILVGKVPDPKAQVEQITIALIYKFMDDMDLEGTELGGNREFFKEEYEKYAWTNIMQSENSGQQRANLYSEGIDKMSMNANLPQLFRDIFRGAYVPYRDPETLNMFLKEISDFRYDNSEDLGNAFEYLLSIMGSQGDAGQFRTPRHIIDMMVEIIDPKKTDSILDPACGTAGFLISSYKYILGKNKDKDGNNTLSADDRKRMTNNFAGYDISPDMVRLSRVNMYLHRFTKPKISEYDTLSSLEKWDETYDVILANPPFMTPKGGIIPHNRYRVPAKRAEVLFVDYIAEHLNPTGKAGIIVPEGIVFQSANAYRALRKYLVEDDLLYAVISLPAGVFNPYSGVKTSILLLDKTLAKQRDDILFVKISNDGYGLGAQRKDIKDSDIPEVINIVKDYQNGNDVSDNALVTVASKESIREHDFGLVGERYKQAGVVNTDYPIVELGEVCNVSAGNSAPQSKEVFVDGEYPFFRTSDVGKVHLSDNLILTTDYLNEEGILGLRLFPKGTVLFPKSGASTFLNHRVIMGVDGYVSSHLACLTCNEEVLNNKFLYRVLINIDAKCLTADQAYPSLNMKQISSIKIPLPPVNIQEEIINEIEGYQKIIDGAMQVVKNYKPTIKIDTSWELVKLGDVCDINKEVVLPNEIFGEKEFIYLDISSVQNGTGKINYGNFVVGNQAPSRARRKLQNGSILLSTVRPNLKAFAYVNFESIDLCVASTGFAVIDTKDANDKFIYYSILQDYLLEQMISSMGKGAYPSINQKDVKNLKLYLPPFKKQLQISNQIDEEMTIIEQNKRLIEIFEQKIKDKISDIWGE